MDSEAGNRSPLAVAKTGAVTRKLLAAGAAVLVEHHHGDSGPLLSHALVWHLRRPENDRDARVELLLAHDREACMFSGRYALCCCSAAHSFVISAG